MVKESRIARALGWMALMTLTTLFCYQLSSGLSSSDLQPEITYLPAAPSPIDSTADIADPADGIAQIKLDQ